MSEESTPIRSPLRPKHDNWMSRFWDWFDYRDVDKHIIAIATMFMTYFIVKWSMSFAEANASKSSMDIAAVLGVINAPYMALQAAVLKFYFEARPTSAE